MENSFEHEDSYNWTDLKVYLSISRVNNWLTIKIHNDGAPIPEERNDDGLGVQNVQERLETLFGENFNFLFTNLKRGEGAAIEIQSPFILAK